MTLDEAIKDIEYGTKQLEMEIESGLWIKGSEPELRCKEGIALNKQHIEWLTELKKAKQFLKVMYEDIKRYAGGMCRVCTECTADFECKCEDFCATNKRSKWKYKYEPEILALIGEEGGNNA